MYRKKLRRTTRKNPWTKFSHSFDALAQKLENSETSLEDSFRYYKKGMELLKYCSQKLDTVEKKMLQMDEDGTLREF